MIDTIKAFLREYRIVIAFFLVCAFIVTAIAASIVFFVKADRLSEAADVRSMMASENTSICETLKRSGGSLDQTAHLLRDHSSFTLTEDSLTLYYDEGFSPASESTASYRTVVTVKDHPGYFGASLKVFDNSDTGREPAYTFTFRGVKEGVRK